MQRGCTTGKGEIIWSMLVPSEVAHEMLDLDGDD